MAKIKKKYSFTNNRQIWRLIPTDSDKIIIEERDKNKKEVYFNCLKINTGEIVFNNLQLQDKFWIGIEIVHKNIIFFHNFLKPGLPIHTGIIAFSIESKKIIWKTDDYNYLFIKDDKIYVYKSRFEGREFAALDYITGNLLEDLGNDPKNINVIRTEGSKNFEGIIFPKQIDLASDYSFTKIINELKTKKTLADFINYTELDNLLFLNFHEVLSTGNYRNKIRIIEIDSKKVILEEILDRETKLLLPESFFIINRLVFLIKEKIKLAVYSF